MKKVTHISQRKSDHIRINLREDVQSALTTGLENYRFDHQALPECNLEDVDTRTVFLNKQLAAPILISSMTGGSVEAAQINLTLAEAAEQTQIAMGLGSQRAAIEHPEFVYTFQVRQVAPSILLFANLGAIQLNYRYGVDECKKAVDMIEADALILHLNPLQEALQPEGDTRFENLIDKIALVCQSLPVPVIVKEVGWGISQRVAKLLIEAGVSVIDVAGAGGTSWSQVEMYRAQSESAARIAANFIDWGIPTAECIKNVRAIHPTIPIIASGGLRNGIDIAKCLALGANLGGMASPFLKAAARSVNETIETIHEIQREIQITMFAAGAKTIAELQNTPLKEI
ncbi:MAG: Isopentenyl-diphosphate delta-isomerase, FMN-dependent [Anaerolineae bacterium]|nr:MAG: Isopentenyl-diphosphate delta-isomerase, FMN-dependent [Anaerolineae bacterium]